MHRDDIPTIRESGRYGVFGGAAEGDETPLETAVREINEETNLTPSTKDFKRFKVYIQARDNLSEPVEFSVFILKAINPKNLEIYEGQGIKILKDANDPNIAKDIKVAFVDWFAQNPVQA